MAIRQDRPRLTARRSDVLEIGSFGRDGIGPTYPHAITTPAGVLVVYFAPADAPTMRMYATLLRCEAP